MKIKHVFSAALIVMLLMTAAASNADTLWESCDVDNTPEYFDDSFSALQGMELNEFAVGLDAEYYGFFTEYVTYASIGICNPQIDEPRDEDVWVFHEFVLDEITLEEAKTLFEENSGKEMYEEEGCYGYEYDGHGFGLYCETDWDGNTNLLYSVMIKSQYLPDIRTIEDYNQITDIPLPSDEEAYLQSLALEYNAAAKDVSVTYEYTFYSGQINDAFEEYCDAVSQIESHIDENNQLTSIVRPGVYLAAWVDPERYDGVDALNVVVEPLPISVFTCGFEDQLNATLESRPVPAVIADLLDIVMPSFTACDLVLDCQQDCMYVTLHSDAYNGRPFYQEVFDYLGMEGESDSSLDGFWYVTDDYRVSFHYNADESYARFEIQASTEEMLDYGQAVMEAYPYALMPVFPEEMDIVGISYPVTVAYDVDQKALSYRQTNEFMMSVEISGSADENGVEDYLLCAYPPRYPEMSDLTVKGVSAFLYTEYYDEDNVTCIEITFRNSDILGRYDEDEE